MIVSLCLSDCQFCLSSVKLYWIDKRLLRVLCKFRQALSLCSKKWLDDATPKKRFAFHSEEIEIEISIHLYPPGHRSICPSHFACHWLSACLPASPFDHFVSIIIINANLCRYFTCAVHRNVIHFAATCVTWTTAPCGGGLSYWSLLLPRVHNMYNLLCSLNFSTYKVLLLVVPLSYSIVKQERDHHCRTGTMPHVKLAQVNYTG